MYHMSKNVKLWDLLPKGGTDPPPKKIKLCRPKKGEDIFDLGTSVAHRIENALRASYLPLVFSTTLGSGDMAKKRTKPNLT